MDKQEIKRRIKRYELVRECAEENLNELNIQLRDLCEAEKPELGHGDFGCFRDGTPRICIMDTVYDKGGRCGKSCDIEYYAIFGNIFDLMKEGSEGLKDRFDINVDYNNRKIIFEKSTATGKDVFMTTGERNVSREDGVHLSLSELEELWHKVGRKVMELKKKQSLT